VDLRASSSPSSLPAGAIAIPTARRPFQAPARASREAAPRPPAWGSSARAGSALRIRRLVTVAEVVLVVVGSYVLIGAGIGDAAGSVMVGMAAGLLAGLCAVAAIMLIRGSALASGTTAEVGGCSESPGT
jgi:hypothetical protein